MKESKRKRLEKAGFKIGTVQEFLGLSDGEMAVIDLKVRLIQMLQTARKSRGLTQSDVAKLLGSSQSRIAKIEAGGADVTLDLICKAMFSIGVSRQALGKMIATSKAA